MVAARSAGKDVVILHVGDYDPSGEDSFRHVEETLRLYALMIDWATSPFVNGKTVRAPAAADVRRSVQGDATACGGT